MNELSLFSGAGGGILGAHMLGWRTVCAVEFDQYARSVLIARQNDGSLPPFPIWDDVRTFDAKPWIGLVDVVTGGFPCQDISVAGKGAGLNGARSGLWREFARILRVIMPPHVLVENSPALTSRGLGIVLRDLAAMGYDAKWGVLGAHHAGAPHKRDRIWIVANARCGRRGEPSRRKDQQQGRAEVVGAGEVANSNRPRRQWSRPAQPEGWNDEAQPFGAGEEVAEASRAGLEELNAAGQSDESGQHPGSPSFWWSCDPGNEPESGVGRVANGVANRVDRLRAIGNGQVPAVVRLAWETLKQ